MTPRRLSRDDEAAEEIRGILLLIAFSDAILFLLAYASGAPW